ncbi:MAG: hypothetical protein OXC65_00435 [Thiotrichales bacterium]|nr:hypothetical protein [Thiotrichales bacterium]
MATARFLHMRLSQDDCDLLDALVVRVNDNDAEDDKDPYPGPPRYRTQSDVVRLAIAEALLRRCEERV